MRKFDSLIKSVVLLIVSILLMGSILFAWFARALVAEINQIPVETIGPNTYYYELYQFESDEYKGNTNMTNPTLINNITLNPTDQKYYQRTLGSLLDFSGTRGTRPADNYSFALLIQNLGGKSVSPRLSFNEVVSSNIPVGHGGINNIQRVFQYDIRKISYYRKAAMNESASIIGNPGVEASNGYFNIGATQFNFAKVPLTAHTQVNSTAVIYFDIYYNPNHYGVDPLDGVTPLPDHGGIFMGQKFTIAQIVIDTE